MFVAVICPESLIDKANHLAGATGYDMRDLESFPTAMWEKDGVNYSVISAEITDAFRPKVESALVRPDYDADNDIDMTKAGQAQLLINFELTDMENNINARYCDDNDDVKQFIIDAGITRIPVVIP